MIHKSPLVSIVIPSFNRKIMLARLLRSVFSNTYKNIEVIVIDDASTDKTYEHIYTKYKKIRIIRNKKNLFAAASRNIGLKTTNGKYIFFVDDDNVLDRKIISFLVDALEKDDKLGEVGPVNYSFENKKKILWAQTRRNMFTTKTNQARDLKGFGHNKSWDTDDILNAYMVRGSVVKKNRIFFREEYGIMYEESDLAYRIRNAGYSVKVVRGAKIFHDIEKRDREGKITDYVYHFMSDARRPFVTARNRILFHSVHSTKLQQLFIFLFWIWLFAVYYSYKILFYSGKGNFSFLKRLALIGSYLFGIINGLFCLVRRQ